jgi:hypothetical protein
MFGLKIVCMCCYSPTLFTRLNNDPACLLASSLRLVC